MRSHPTRRWTTCRRPSIGRVILRPERGSARRSLSAVDGIAKPSTERGYSRPPEDGHGVTLKNPRFVRKGLKRDNRMPRQSCRAGRAPEILWVHGRVGLWNVPRKRDNARNTGDNLAAVSLIRERANWRSERVDVVARKRSRTWLRPLPRGSNRTSAPYFRPVWRRVNMLADDSMKRLNRSSIKKPSQRHWASIVRAAFRPDVGQHLVSSGAQSALFGSTRGGGRLALKGCRQAPGSERLPRDRTQRPYIQSP